jgi:hypothetical protein
VEGGVDGEADQPDRTVGVDEDVLGHEASVGHLGLVGEGQGVGDLRDDPRRDRGRERAAVGEQDVEAGARPPLVDHEAPLVRLVDVQHPEHPAVEHGGRGAGGLAQQRRALVVAGDDVDGDVALQHRVEGAPEPSALALGEQVGQSVPVGEHVAGPGVLSHLSPSRRSLPHVRRHGPPESGASSSRSHSSPR